MIVRDSVALSHSEFSWRLAVVANTLRLCPVSPRLSGFSSYLRGDAH
jgi:hypothetical protein